MKHIQGWGWGICLLISSYASADSIVIEGKTLDNVYIREGSSMYYIQTPADGRILSISKSTVNTSDIHLSKDPKERQALLDQWKTIRNITPTTTPPVSNDLQSASQSQSPVLANKINQRILGDEIKRLNTPPPNMPQKSISIHHAAVEKDPTDTRKFLERQKNILMQRKMAGTPQTYAYDLQPGSDTLPKIVVGQGTMAPGGGHFNNVSELFGTIDDRVVGEMPPSLDNANPYNSPYTR